MSSFESNFKTTVRSQNYQFNGPNLITVISTMFISCSSLSNGGAVFCHQPTAKGCFKFCSFSECSAYGNRGGALCVFSAEQFHMSHICCFMNSADWGNHVVYWADSTKLLKGSFNYSSETSQFVSKHGTTLGGNKFYGHSINVTDSKTNNYASGLLILYTPSTEVVSYVIHVKGRGNGIWHMETFNSSIVANSIAIDNTILPGHGYVSCLQNKDIVFKSCVFIGSGKAQLVSMHNPNVVTLSVTFIDCAFDFEVDSSLTSLATVFNLRPVSTENFQSQVLQSKICLQATSVFTSPTLHNHPSKWTLVLFQCLFL